MTDDKKQKDNRRFLRQLRDRLSQEVENWRRLLFLGVAALVSVIAVGYLIDHNKNREWADWTGFGEGITIEETRQKKDDTGPFTETKKYQSGKTLWDLLELAAVPILIVFIGYQLEVRDRKRNEKQAELQRKLAQDNLAEEAIQAYLDNMAKLLLDKELRRELFSKKSKVILGVSIEGKEDNNNPVRDVARAQTVTILRRLKSSERLSSERLSSERLIRIMDFLRDSELGEVIFKGINLSRINLSKVSLKRINLQGAILERADLKGAILEGADLKGADLKGAILEGADLKGAILEGADLKGAILEGADLKEADLKGAILQSAILNQATFREAELQGANLEGAVMVNLAKGEEEEKENVDITYEQIRSTCLWEKAIYKGEWNKLQKTWVAIESDNTKYIEGLKKVEGT